VFVMVRKDESATTIRRVHDTDCSKLRARRRTSKTKFRTSLSVYTQRRPAAEAIMFSLCHVVPMSAPLSLANMDSSGRVHYTHAAAEAS